ncbi:hypothetical protein PROFUN_11744 [Planoprotostelium fungivorum]|uniref:Uncharacterized protein n=1 Tax=Planoprotostelium fungivorum TaxID=1890364 RepID=A0A2P6MYF6_9EUKA|nr:hypothetical protein PROFUN_11744 [Planoprotostelium fungivorum]
MSVVRIVYHCPCPDGAFGALAAWLYFRYNTQMDLKFVPNSVFQHPAIEDMKLSPLAEVYYIDCTPPEPFLTQVASQCKKIIILDHHKTALEDNQKLRTAGKLPENVEAHYDMKKSGATMAWDYFRNLTKIKHDYDRFEEIYGYIEDNDLWKRALPNSRRFSVGLAGENLNFDYNSNPDLFIDMMSLDIQQLIERGKALSSKQQDIIDREIEKSFAIQMEGFGTFLAVLTRYGDLRSEMGNQLAVKSESLGHRGIAAVVYREEKIEDESKLKVSLRSLPEEDTSVISKKYGGGGHKNASSFVEFRISDEEEHSTSMHSVVILRLIRTENPFKLKESDENVVDSNVTQGQNTQFVQHKPPPVNQGPEDDMNEKIDAYIAEHERRAQTQEEEENRKKQVVKTELTSGGPAYEGEMVDGRPHGQGRAAYRDGSVYQGEWKNGFYHGYGIMKWTNGATYRGFWSEGVAEGFGQCEDHRGTFEGTWRNNMMHGVARMVTINGSYTGQVHFNQRHGLGVMKSLGNLTYAGEWKEDKATGYGRCRWTTGQVYLGQFEDGKAHGFGKTELAGPLGFIHEGEYKNGAFQGRGILKKNTGLVYTGDFEDNVEEGFGRTSHREYKRGKREGHGWLIRNDGLSYQGSWMNNAAHGSGMIVTPRFTYSGELVRGTPHGEGEMNDQQGGFYRGPWNNGTPVNHPNRLKIKPMGPDFFH